MSAVPHDGQNPRPRIVAREGFDGAKGVQACILNHVLGVGTAPLDDSLFRSALFEQLGEPRLEGAVTTDICGKKDSHAIRLDKEAEEAANMIEAVGAAHRSGYPALPQSFSFGGQRSRRKIKRPVR